MVGVLLGGNAVLSFADSVSAVWGDGYVVSNVEWYPDFVKSTPGEACEAFKNGGGGFTSYSVSGMICTLQPTNQSFTIIPKQMLYCPPGGYVREGAICTRADCPEGLYHDQSGQCVCPSGKSLKNGLCTTDCPTGWHNHVPDDGQCEKDCTGRQKQRANGYCGCDQETGVASTNYAALETRCIGGCAVSWSAGVVNPLDASNYMTYTGQTTTAQKQAVSAVAIASFSGATCSEPNTIVPVDLTLKPADKTGTAADNVTPDKKNTEENAQSPESCASAGGAYGVYNGVGKCLTPSSENLMDAPKLLKVDTKSKEVTNPDGTKTETKEITSTFKDPKTGQSYTEKSTVTVQKDANGNVTGTGTGSEKGDSSSEGQCAKEPNSPMCKQGSVKDKGHYTNEQDGRLQAKKEEFRAAFANIKAQAQNVFNVTLGAGSGSLPCPPPVSILGKPFTICAKKYEDQLAVIGQFVLLVSSVIAVFIVLRR